MNARVCLTSRVHIKDTCKTIHSMRSHASSESFKIFQKFVFFFFFLNANQYAINKVCLRRDVEY